MIIFRIIGNLIHLALNLFWLPINLLMHNLFLVIILIAAVVFFIALSDDNSAPETISIDAAPVRTATQQPTPAPVIRDKNAPMIRIDAVRKTEDGNSSFASDVMKMMTDPERAYYSQIFYWTMNNSAGGKTVKWENANTYGSITPQAIFLNKRGHACRNFTEILKVHDIKQTIEGTACQRGGGAWCKLALNATPACGLGQMPSLWNDLKRSVGF